MIELSHDQMKWLDVYMSIDLHQWRMIFIGQEPSWMYVGDWDYIGVWDGYSERQRNLEEDRYHYWPDKPCFFGAENQQKYPPLGFSGPKLTENN